MLRSDGADAQPHFGGDEERAEDERADADDASPLLSLALLTSLRLTDLPVLMVDAIERVAAHALAAGGHQLPRLRAAPASPAG